MVRGVKTAYPHPLLNPQNGWTFRFLPGLLLGALLHYWFSGTKAKLPVKTEDRVGATKSTSARKQAVPAPREELKMVLCVNNELKMNKGKIAAQCCHAAVGVFQAYSTASSHRIAFKQWSSIGQKKIALRVDSTAELEQLASTAQAAGLPFYVVTDAGRTQIAAGSRTVVAIGPGYESDVSAITGHLPLL